MNKSNNNKLAMLAKVIAAAVAVIVTLLSSIWLLIVLAIWALLDNYEHCTLPFEMECRVPDKVYQEDPITNDEILETVYGSKYLDKDSDIKGMVNIRKDFLKNLDNPSSADDFKNDIPILDSEDLLAKNSKLTDEEKSGTATAKTGSSGNALPGLENGKFPLDDGYKSLTDNYGTLQNVNGKSYKLKGLEIFAPKDTKVYSSLDGTVIAKGWSKEGGWILAIKTEDNVLYYGHMSKYAPGIEENDTVKKGTLIGYVGSTGFGKQGTKGLIDNQLIFGIFTKASNWLTALLDSDTSIDPFKTLQAWEARNSSSDGPDNGGADNGGADNGGAGSPKQWKGDYATEINGAGAKYGVDPLLIAAVIQQESSWNPGVCSGVGACGLMQLMPSTAAGLGVTNRMDASQSINGGAKLLSQNLKAYKGNVEYALYAYNWGGGALNQCLKGIFWRTGAHGCKVPDTMPKETRDYAPSVLAHYKRFSGGDMNIYYSGGSLLSGGAEKPDFSDYKKMKVLWDTINKKEIEPENYIKQNYGSDQDFLDTFHFSKSILSDRTKLMNAVAKSTNGSYKVKDAYINEAELHLRSVIDANYVGTVGVDPVDLEMLQALMKIKRQIENQELAASKKVSASKLEKMDYMNTYLENEPVLTKNTIPNMRKDFAQWLKDQGYYKSNSQSNIDKALSKTNIKRKKIMSDAAKDEIYYPYIAVALGYNPTKADDKFKSDVKKKFDEIKKDKNISDDLLSVLSIGHFMKDQGLKVYKDDLHWFTTFNKDDKVEEFKNYVMSQRNASQDPDKILSGNKTGSTWDEIKSDVKTLFNIKKMWKRYVTYHYFDMAIENNTFIRFVMYNDTDELIEIGAYARGLCFYTESYGIDNSKGNDAIKDLCISINDSAYGSGKLDWEQSDVLDKYNISVDVQYKCVISGKKPPPPPPAAVKSVQNPDDKGISETFGGSYNPPLPQSVIDRQKVLAWFGIGKDEPKKRPRYPVKEEALSGTNGSVAISDISDLTGGWNGIPNYDDARNSLDKSFGGKDGKKALKDNEGLKVGTVTRSGGSYSLDYVDIETNAKVTYSIPKPPDCDKKTEQSEKYIYKLSNSYTKSVSAYYTSLWDAFYQSKEFNIYINNTNLKKDSDGDALFKREALDSFETATNVDYSENQSFIQSFEDWLTNGTSGGGEGGESGGASGGGSFDTPYTMYEGLELGMPMPVKPGEKITITSGMGTRSFSGHVGENHKGVDFKGVNNAGLGTPVLAMADGKVYIAVNSAAKTSWGTYIVLEHTTSQGKKVYTLYGHMIFGSETVKVGDTVKRGQQIGKLGSTGDSTAPHTHVEIRLDNFQDKKYVNAILALNLNKSNAWCQPGAPNCANLLK